MPLRNAERLPDLVVVAKLQHVNGPVHRRRARREGRLFVDFALAQAWEDVREVSPLGRERTYPRELIGARSQPLAEGLVRRKVLVVFARESPIRIRRKSSVLAREHGEMLDENIGVMRFLRPVRGEPRFFDSVSPLPPIPSAPCAL